MKKVHQSSFLLFFVFVSYVAFLDRVPVGLAQEHTKSLDPYAGLTFTEAPSVSHRLNNSELLETLDMFAAFPRGAMLLPKYRDSVLTRSAKGISLFRSVAPAVTLVVVGNDSQIEGLGTGALVRSDGYVLTNWHVIAGHSAALVFLKPARTLHIYLTLSGQISDQSIGIPCRAPNHLGSPTV